MSDSQASRPARPVPLESGAASGTLLDRLERAAEEFEDGLERARILLRIAGAQLRLGRGREAAGRLATAARLLIEAGLYPRAEAAIRQLLRIQPCDPEQLESLGRFALRAGLLERGTELFLGAAGARFERDEAQTARALLKELETAQARLPEEAVLGIAALWCTVGGRARAGILIRDAAEQTRSRGDFAAAVALCRRGVELGANAGSLHRTLGLALLGLDQAAAARPHLQAWATADTEGIDACIWYAEALFALGQRERTRQLLDEISERAGHADRHAPEGARLLRLIADRLRMEPLLMESRAAPFWDADELFSESDETEDRTLGPDRERPRVFIAEDAEISRKPLSRVLEDAGLQVALASEGASLAAELRDLPVSPDLLILPIADPDPASLDLVRELRRCEQWRDTPILGVATVDQSRIDLKELHFIGISEVISSDCTHEAILSRVEQLIRRPHEQRLFVRAPTQMPVELESGGAATAENAFNLAIGGMRVTSSRPLPPNTDVVVRFRLPGHEHRPLEVKGRVIYTHDVMATAAYELGLFFYPMEAHTQQLIGFEVERLLSE